MLEVVTAALAGETFHVFAHHLHVGPELGGEGFTQRWTDCPKE
jgi:hypothetical protein